jgi:ABC-2 type transport system ATP-binding protein
MDRAAIELNGLTRYYGSARGIEDLHLRVFPGEVFGFLGPNGAGKTTTIRLLFGLIRPSQGTIRLLGQDVPKHFPELRRRVGYLPGDLGLYPDLSGREYLHHMLRLRAGRDANPEKLEELTDLFEFTFDKPIRTYSKGMRQMLGIIQAFAHSPELIILDEPTSGLDPINQERFYDMVLRERAAGTTIFFSSHILSEVRQVCDRAAMVRQGRLVQVRDVHQLQTEIGKRIRLVSTGGSNQVAAALKDLTGVSKLASQGDAVEFQYTGAINNLLQKIANIPITDLVCVNPEIEEIFFDLYRE